MKPIMINDVPVIPKTYDGNRVVSFNDVAKVHGQTTANVGQRFKYNRSQFREGTDYYLINQGTLKKLEKKSLAVRGNPKTNAYLLTESGYLMLVKTMGDKLSWDIQRKLVDNYFACKDKRTTNNATSVVVQSPIIQEAPKSDGIDKLYADQLAFVKQEAARNEAFRNMIMESFQMLGGVIKNQSDLIGQLIANQKSVEKSDYEKWRDEIYAVIGDRDRNAMLSAAYKYLNKVYGIVWEQERVDYAKANNGRTYSTMELMYWVENNKPHCNGLLKGSIERMIQEDK